MTTTATITQLHAPQTVTVLKPTTPVRFDALLEMVTSSISADHTAEMTETSTFTATQNALWAFVDDGVTNEFVIVREFAMALATMMSSERLPLEDSIHIAHNINGMSFQRDFPSVIDWSGRERHARHTASLMFALIHKRQQSGDLPQQTSAADALH